MTSLSPTHAQSLSPKIIRKTLPKRSAKDNKTAGGKLLIIAGSDGLWGSGILAAMAATRTGAGYTYLMMPQFSKLLLKHPDFLFQKPNLKLVTDPRFSARLIGPGIGQNTQAKQWVTQILKNKNGITVLDADALNILSKRKPKILAENFILTPHEGELARLINWPSKKVKSDRMAAIKYAHSLWGGTILLKGATTLVLSNSGFYKNTSGTPALAKAGTGDVLSGIIAALCAQGLPPLEAAVLGTHIHGLCSQRYLKKGNDVLSLRPQDLIAEIPRVLHSLR